MNRSIPTEFYTEAQPPTPFGLLAPMLRPMRILAILVGLLLFFAVGGSFLPLTTWLILVAGLAVPTAASLLLVAEE